MALAAGEHWIAMESGRLFARVWAPARARPEPAATILMLHESLGSVALWRDFPARLAQATGRHVAAYDRLGYGRSEARTGRLPGSFVADEAEEVVPRVCDALGLKRIVPFGHSVGGGMALAMAARWPERCAAVISEGAQCYVEQRTLAGIRAAQTEFALPGQRERLARYHGAKARWVLEAWTGTWLDPAFAGWRLDAVVARVLCPALILHGERDEYGSRAQPERIAGLVCGPARTVILEACGHVPHRERAERVLEESAHFLAGQD